MRRTGFVVLAGLFLQLAWPSPASAWWGWLDELTGPKGFNGIQMDARIKCFGAPRSTLEMHLAAIVQLDKAIQDDVKGLGERRRDRSGPDDFDQLLDTSSRLAHTASELVGTFVPRPALESQFSEADISLLLTLGSDPAVSANVAKLEEELRQVRDNSFQAFPIDHGRAGMSLTLCKPKDDAERRFAVNLGTRVFWTTDTSPELEGDSEAYAGGHRMYLFTAIPTLEYRPLYIREKFCNRTDCQKSDWLDLIDLGAGAGYYRISSEGLEPLQGTVLEVRANFRLPSSIPRKYRWTRAVPQFSIGRLGFVDGFEANAFGPNLKTPEKAAAKHAGEVDWTTEYAIFVDLLPFLR